MDALERIKDDARKGMAKLNSVTEKRAEEKVAESTRREKLIARVETMCRRELSFISEVLREAESVITLDSRIPLEFVRSEELPESVSVLVHANSPARITGEMKVYSQKFHIFEETTNVDFTTEVGECLKSLWEEAASGDGDSNKIGGWTDIGPEYY